MFCWLFLYSSLASSLFRTKEKPWFKSLSPNLLYICTQCTLPMSCKHATSKICLNYNEVTAARYFYFIFYNWLVKLNIIINAKNAFCIFPSLISFMCLVTLCIKQCHKTRIWLQLLKFTKTMLKNLDHTYCSLFPQSLNSRRYIHVTKYLKILLASISTYLLFSIIFLSSMQQ